MYKIGIVTLGASLSNKLSLATRDEIAYTAIIAQKAGHEVNIIGKVDGNTFVHSNSIILDIEDVAKDPNKYNFTHIFFWCGSINFFGGSENRSLLLAYTILNNFKGKVSHWLVDNRHLLYQCWDSVSKKPWKDNYAQRDIEIIRKDIACVSQFYDLEKTNQLIQEDKKAIKTDKIVHFPISRFPLYVERLKQKSTIFKTMDIGYGGYFRANRKDRLQHFYLNNTDLSIEIFGKLELNDFKLEKSKTIFREKVIKHTELSNYMSKFWATIIVGDTWYEDNNVAARVYESVMSGCITFIDKQYDRNYKIFPKEMNLHVDNIDEVSERLNYYKQNKNEYRKLIQDQVKTLLEQYDDVSSFNDVMKMI